MKKTIDHFGAIDILVNNAGVMYYTRMQNRNIKQWHDQIDVNCKVSRSRMKNVKRRVKSIIVLTLAILVLLLLWSSNNNNFETSLEQVKDDNE